MIAYFINTSLFSLTVFNRISCIYCVWTYVCYIDTSCPAVSSVSSVSSAKRLRLIRPPPPPASLTRRSVLQTPELLQLNGKQFNNLHIIVSTTPTTHSEVCTTTNTGVQTQNPVITQDSTIQASPLEIDYVNRMHTINYARFDKWVAEVFDDDAGAVNAQRLRDGSGNSWTGNIPTYIIANWWPPHDLSTRYSSKRVWKCSGIGWAGTIPNDNHHQYSE